MLEVITTNNPYFDCELSLKSYQQTIIDYNKNVRIEDLITNV